MHVYSDLAGKVERELDGLSLAPPVSISNVTDPCQNIPELRAEVSRLISLLIRKGLFFFITTKGDPGFLLDLEGFARYPRKFVSITIEGTREMVRLLSPRAASFDIRLATARRLSSAGVSLNIRLDPFLLHLARALHGREWEEELRILFHVFADSGARHVISSTGRFWNKSLRDPASAWAKVHRVVGSLSASEAACMHRDYIYDKSATSRGYLLRRDLRLALHLRFREIAQEHGMTYAVCQELPFGEGDSQGIPHCEGFPMSFSEKIFGGGFAPIRGCTAYCHRDCIGLERPPCGRPSLVKPGPFRRRELI